LGQTISVLSTSAFSGLIVHLAAFAIFDHAGSQIVIFSKLLDAVRFA
jgi:hypothetical protein